MFERPEFPEGMPKELQDKILEALEKVEKHLETWEPVVSAMDNVEFTALAMIVEHEKHSRIVDKIADRPEVQEAVRRKGVTDLPDIIPLPANNKDRMN